MRDVLATTVIVGLGGPGLDPAIQRVVGNPYLHLVVNPVFAAFVVVTVSRAGRMKVYSGTAILIADCLMFFFVAGHHVRVFLQGGDPPNTRTGARPADRYNNHFRSLTGSTYGGAGHAEIIRHLLSGIQGMGDPVNGGRKWLIP